MTRPATSRNKKSHKIADIKPPGKREERAATERRVKRATQELKRAHQHRERKRYERHLLWRFIFSVMLAYTALGGVIVATAISAWGWMIFCGFLFIGHVRQVKEWMAIHDKDREGN